MHRIAFLPLPPLQAVTCRLVKRCAIKEAALTCVGTGMLYIPGSPTRAAARFLLVEHQHPRIVSAFVRDESIGVFFE